MEKLGKRILRVIAVNSPLPPVVYFESGTVVSLSLAPSV